MEEDGELVKWMKFLHIYSYRDGLNGIKIWFVHAASIVTTFWICIWLVSWFGFWNIVSVRLSLVVLELHQYYGTILIVPSTFILIVSLLVS